jgi:hypothetical protein
MLATTIVRHAMATVVQAAVIVIHATTIVEHAAATVVHAVAIVEHAVVKRGKITGGGKKDCRPVIARTRYD